MAVTMKVEVSKYSDGLAAALELDGEIVYSVHCWSPSDWVVFKGIGYDEKTEPLIEHYRSLKTAVLGAIKLSGYFD